MPQDTSQSFSILTGRQLEEKKQNGQISLFVTQCQTSLPNKYEIIHAKLAINPKLNIAWQNVQRSLLMCRPVTLLLSSPHRSGQQTSSRIKHY